MASRSTAPEKRPGFFAQLRSLFTFTKAEFSWLGWALIGMVVLGVAIGLLIGATSTLVNQAALVVDRGDEAVALDRAGYPRSLFARIRRHHVLAPLLITLTTSIGVGLLLATPFMTFFRLQGSGVVLVLVTVVAGLLLTVGAAEACRPLQRAVLTQAHRRND